MSRVALADLISHLTRLIMVAAMAAPTPHPHERPLTFEGSLSRYDPLVMERVLEWRHTNGIPSGFSPWPIDAPPYDGYIAVIGCEHVGKVAYLTLTIDGVTLPEAKTVYIADCTSPGRPAAEWMVSSNIAAEVDYAAWQSWGIVDGEGAWVRVEIQE